MLVPVCCERLPVRLEVKVISAKGLPIMNKSVNSTDGYVDIRYGDFEEKTEVVTSLNPEWNDTQHVLDTDEKELTEQLLQFRIMDYDTYTANDAIGRVDVDCSIFVEKMRMNSEEAFEDTCTMPIYDSMNGFCGELVFQLNIHLLINFDHRNYVQIFSEFQVPPGHKVVEIGGLVNDLRCVVDPDHEWIDRIRSNRATNSARLTVIRESLRLAAVALASKVGKMDFNAIVGYNECIDIEEPSSHFITVRVIGTAIRTAPIMENILPFLEMSPFPIFTISAIPILSQLGIGAVVSAKAVHILDDDDEEPEAVRRSWWNELRVELNQQSLSLGCNIVIGYSEQLYVNNGLAFLSCFGTAVLVDFEMTSRFHYGLYQVRSGSTAISEKSIGKLITKQLNSEIHCSTFHTTLADGDNTVKSPHLAKCTKCNESVSNFIFSTTECPPSCYIQGNNSFIQVCVAKKLNDCDDRDDTGQELSTALPFLDHELFSRLMAESKVINPSANAIFDIRFTYAINEELIICVATGILVRLVIIPNPIPTTAQSPLGLSAFQKYNDARRFSWSSVRDAIRFRGQVTTPGVSIRTINLNSLNKIDDVDKIKKNAWSDILRRRQMEKERLGQMLFERQLGAYIGYIDVRLAQNGNTVAGIHIAPTVFTFLKPKDDAGPRQYLGRWSDLIIREDDVKDVNEAEYFIANTLEGQLNNIRRISASYSAEGYAANFRINVCQFSISSQKAYLILNSTCSLYNSDF